MTFSTGDRTILRDLAKQLSEISKDPVMETRRRMWTEHNSLRSKHPMMLIFPEGSFSELLPEKSYKCTDKSARGIERELRMRIYTYDHFQDDTVAENKWIVQKRIINSGWGLEAKWIPKPSAGGAYHYDPIILEPSDLKKLCLPEISYDEKNSAQELKDMQDLFGDILDVSLQGIKHISYHLMGQYAALRGLEEIMVDMYSEPQMLHDAMALFEEGHKKVLKQYVELKLLSFNNDNTYHNSGGNSYTDQLPLPDADPKRERPKDMWSSAEAQEMAQVSPEHHAEFILPYEKRLLEPFGLTGYGCCEDLTRKLDYVFTIPHIRRISISPWADVDICSEKLKGNYIFSWKPNPAHMVGNFNADAIRKYISHTMDVTRKNGCVLEMILKDTHTCENHPERFDQWTKIARELITESGRP